MRYLWHLSVPANDYRTTFRYAQSVQWRTSTKATDQKYIIDCSFQNSAAFSYKPVSPAVCLELIIKHTPAICRFGKFYSYGIDSWK